MNIKCQHIAANCNPMPHTLQFVDQRTIAFCFRNQVGIYCLKQNRIMMNINNRKISPNRANCLKVIKSDNQVFITVGYDNGNLCLYKKRQQFLWDIKQTIKQDSAIAFMYESDGYLLTGNNESEIRIYKIQPYKQQILNQINKITFPLNKALHSVAAIRNKNNLNIFMGGVDQKIHCYALTQQNKLSYIFSLAGHENAITKLAITKIDQDYFLSSSSKDGYVRLWRITQNQQAAKFHKNVKILDESWKVFLDSVLINHQCSVTNLCWVNFGGVKKLASCSLDCTICLWGHEGEEAWSVDNRMGQFLGNKNAYFNIVTDPSNRYLVAVNYIGSALIWEYNENNAKFNLRPSFNGHFNEVRDIDWNHSGDFLVSVSMDQTTRIICHNKITNNYHEISRAQVHGYDINAVATVKVDENLIDVIACGADEKVIRIVQPPASFANFLNSSTKANLHLYFPNKQEQEKVTLSKPQDPVLLYQTYQQGGTQVLGLMTKVQRVQRQKITSYYDDEQQEAEIIQEQAQIAKDSKIDFCIPPNDDYLLKHTLWPQMNKLYGHPHEISCLAKNNDRKLLVSSCFGLTKIACSMIVWDSHEWKMLKIIQHHNFSIYDMKFSPCSNYLASVSKDRKLAVFDKNFDLFFSYEAHTRAINCLAFSPDSKFIITGSRDKIIKIHSIEQKRKIDEIILNKQVYAIEFCTQSLIAAGLENGTIIFMKKNNDKWEKSGQVQDQYSHTQQITALRWSKGRLASAGKDHSVRVFKIDEN